MKTIGLIGGMSWESTITYYSTINELVKEKLGGLHSAKILMYSVDFDEIERCQSQNNWDLAAEILSNAALSLEKAGADFILICTNTMHKVYGKIQESISIPVIHIADATAEILKNNNIKKVLLLGTKYTMCEDFYKQKLVDGGFEIIIPDNTDIEIVNRIIFEELCVGKIIKKSQEEYLRIISKAKENGAEAVILGCTEIGLLLNGTEAEIPLYDTTIIHAKKAVQIAT